MRDLDIVRECLRLFLRRGIFAVLIMMSVEWEPTGNLLAQDVSRTVRFDLKNRGRKVKIQHGLVATSVATVSPSEPQVEVFGRDGNKKLSLNVLGSLEGAKTLSVWDMAVGKSGLIAVGAVATDASDRLASTLLLYDSSGQLQSAFALPAEREVLKLEVDEEDNIWVVGGSSGAKDPETVQMLTKYSPAGKILSEFLPRSQFGIHAMSTEEGVDVGGRVSFGLAGESVWIWLPPSQLVTMNRNGGDIRLIDTGKPSWPGPGGSTSIQTISVEGCHLLPSGALLANVLFKSDNATFRRLSKWEPGTKDWRIISNPIYDLATWPAFLVGIEKSEMAMTRVVKEISNSFVEVLWDSIPSK